MRDKDAGRARALRSRRCSPRAQQQAQLREVSMSKCQPKQASDAAPLEVAKIVRSSLDICILQKLLGRGPCMQLLHSSQLAARCAGICAAASYLSETFCNAVSIALAGVQVEQKSTSHRTGSGRNKVNLEALTTGNRTLALQEMEVTPRCALCFRARWVTWSLG